MMFQISGQRDFENKQHLLIFGNELAVRFRGIKLPHRQSNWLNQFLNLINCLEVRRKKTNKKIVIFFDELPWLCRAKSKFLAALGFFGNNWARKNNVILVVCGSSSSWMLENIVNEKGSLYNRMTQLIRVAPFTLAETKIFLNTEQLMQLYRVMGGIPHYLKKAEPGKSAVQIIQQTCFSKNGLLATE